MSILAVIGIGFVVFYAGVFCGGLMASRKLDETIDDLFRFKEESR